MGENKPGTNSPPQLTLGWRLKMALKAAGLTGQEMAELLGVEPSTVSRWTNDAGTPPKPGFVRAWAHICGVDYDWLAEPVAPPAPPTVPLSARSADSQHKSLRHPRKPARRTTKGWKSEPERGTNGTKSAPLLAAAG